MTAKSFFSTTAALTLATSLASAGFFDRPNDIAQQEPPPINLPQDNVAPPAGPRARCGGNWELGLSFIYWKTQYSQANYLAGGYLGSNPTIAFGSSIPRGKVTQLDWTYEPGFKAQLGWTAPSNHWQVFAEYTWRYQPPSVSHGKASYHNANPVAAEDTASPVITAGSGSSDITIFPDKASAQWSQHFNVLDLMLATNFYLTRTFSLQPMIGLKTYDMKTKVDFNYYDVTFGGLATFIGSTVHIYESERAMGIGPRLGGQSVFNFNRNWGVYGGIFFSIPWSYFKERRHDTITPPGGTASPVHNVEWKTHLWQSVTECQLGLGYQAWFNHEKYLLAIKAGWELQLWGSNLFLSSKGVPGDLGTLSMQGLTLKASFSF